MSSNINDKKAALDNLKSVFEDGSNATDLKPDKISPANLSNIATSLISTVLKVDSSANRLIDNVIQSTRNQLSSKGRVEVDNGKITFTPVKNQSYDSFKQKFNRDVSRIKNRVDLLDKKIKALELLYKTINLTIIALDARFIIEQIKTIIASKASQAESSSPSPSKPTTGETIGTKIPEYELRISKLEGKPVLPLFNKTDAIILLLRSLRTALKNYVSISKQNLIVINNRLDSLQLLIGTSNEPELRDELNKELVNNADTELVETYGNYILKIQKLANGSYQAVATDLFSGLKISQTAPSKFLKPDALFNELKQILNI